MYSIELVIIIPIIVILIATALMMFQFATELDVFEIQQSRGFLLSLSAPSSLNGGVSNVELVQTPYQMIRTKYVYDAQQVGLNAFEILNGKSHYIFENRFYAMKNSRIAISFIKTGYDQFLNMDR